MTKDELRKLAIQWVALKEHETAQVVLFGDEDLVGFIEWVEARLADEPEASHYCIDCNEAHDPRTCGALKSGDGRGD